MPDRRVPTLFAGNDLLWSLLACMLVAVVLIAQRTKPVEDKSENKAGSISVYIFWADGQDLDIDTHLLDPDGEHVYFAHQSGKIWNLLRDDLGMINDASPRNFENAFARGQTAGEYVVNVQAYRGNLEFYPATVEVEIRVAGESEASHSGDAVIRRRVVLDRTGEEVTAARFLIDAHGNLVPGSVNSIFQQLATPKG